MKYVRLIGTGALAICMLLVLIAGCWFARGGRIYSVQTGSMRPLIKPGDAVLVQNNTAVTIGDIVSYRDGRQPWLVISHRIVAMPKAYKQVITKGDANSRPDSAIAQQQIIGQVRFVAPGLGRLLQWLRTPWGLVIAVYVPAFTLIVTVVRPLFVTRTYYRR